ncbi:S-type pyocin domain-containing protein [Pseudomonas sp. MLB6B]
MSNLIPADRSDLVQQIQPSTSINLPYWMAGIENEEDLDLYVVPGSGPIAIREAAFDSERQLYSLALEKPQRILTWTPATAPGTETGNLTPLPSEPSTVVIYEGASLTPTDSLKNYYPGHEAIDQDRLIVTFPTDSGLPPILVVFRSPRYEPGTAHGQGTAITEPWRAATSSINGAPIPDRIAEALRGMEFKTFDAFRKRFWKTIANDVEFSELFSEDDLFRMKKEGYAPRVDFIDSYKRHATLVLHHLLPINEGGGVYDIDNIRVVTPAVHHAIHYGVKQ